MAKGDRKAKRVPAVLMPLVPDPEKAWRDRVNDQRRDERARAANPEYVADAKQRIINSVSLGQEDRTACEFNGVRFSFFEKWKLDDPQFALDLEAAYRLATSRLVDRAYVAGMMGDPKLLERSLEIRDKDRFGPKGAGGGAAKSLDDMTLGELSDLVGALRAREAVAKAEVAKTVDGECTVVDEPGQ